MVSKQKKDMALEEKDNKIIFNILFITGLLIVGGFIYSIVNKPQPTKASIKNVFETSQQVKIT